MLSRFRLASCFEVMFETISEPIQPNQGMKYYLKYGGNILSFARILNLWRESRDFRIYFSQILADSPFTAYRWETPPITRGTLGRRFEFVLLDTAWFATRRTDDVTFSDYFTDDEADCGIVKFPNLGGDALLVVPSPRTNNLAYGHLAAFIRSAPRTQVDAIWRFVSEAVLNRVSTNPIWISTAGGGVAWMHVRLDTFPKYYGYSDYKIA